MVEVKNFDAGFGCGKSAVVLKGTGHFALQTACAFVRIDVQYFLHTFDSCGLTIDSSRHTYVLQCL
jgi:hypothetical protein